MRMTIDKINAALEAAGAEERIAQIDGRLQFVGGSTEKWPQTVVPVKRPGLWSLVEWVEKWREMSPE
jgi:hypothetical protein